jgi:hypothetical protein
MDGAEEVVSERGEHKVGRLACIDHPGQVERKVGIDRLEDASGRAVVGEVDRKELLGAHSGPNRVGQGGPYDLCPDRIQGLAQVQADKACGARDQDPLSAELVSEFMLK